MLAQNFKTPAQLRISSKKFDALVKVMGMLERGELKHVEWTEDPEIGFGFNMLDFSNECGSVCCIAGWCDKLYDTHFVRSPLLPSGLNDLFFVYDCKYPTDEITTAHAAQAIRNYLVSGDPRWNEVVAE